MGVRASPEQFIVLIKFMETHGDLTKPQPGPAGRIRADRLWDNLTALLNSMQSGVVKSSEKWKKVWADWKAKSKKKSTSVRSHASGTGGGGPRIGVHLSSLEKRVLALMGVTAVEGQTGVEEQELNVTVNEDQNIRSPQSPALAAKAESPTSDDFLFVNVNSATNDETPMTLRRQSPVQTSIPSTSGVTTAGIDARRSSSPSSISPPRRLASPPLRRRHTKTAFKRATQSFIDIETRRLKLEELREQSFHEREMERLKLEERRLNLEAERLQQNSQMIEINKEHVAVLRLVVENILLKQPKQDHLL